ncbi:MAG: methyl-accepting chemotaxis protein [Archaeoglobaceae archaeon]
MSSEVLLETSGERNELELLKLKLVEKEREIERLHKEIENKTIEAEKTKKMLETIFRVIPKPVYIYFVDREGKIRYVNDYASEFFQKRREEIVGHRPSELFYVDKEKKKTLADVGAKTMIERALEKGGMAYESQELKYETTMGQIFMLTSGAPVNVDGEFLGMVGFFVDVSKIKEQEEMAKKASEIAKTKEEEVRELYNYTKQCINELSRGIRELSSGNLNVRLTKLKDDDFGKTFESFNEFVQILNQIITNLAENMKGTVRMATEANEAVSQINSGMEQINSASQQISKGSENLSRLANSSVVDLKSLQELIKRVSENVIEVEKFSGEAEKSAEVAKDRGSKAIGMLGEILDNIESTAKIVETLEIAVRNIGKVTERIKSIADQTNLLALNAAIEAARAGEHGRGFAVVADEVRKLAEESRRSTEEISEIVLNVQEGTKRVINAIQNVKKTSESGKEGISSALKMADQISTAVERIGNMLQNITSSIKESNLKLEAVAKSFEEVASTAEENAASSEETSAAIEEQTAAIQQITDTIRKVNEIAKLTLNSVVEKFKISVN